ncbi:MAG TPA: hypothetical protein VF179_27560 [Thermoanaerobaculia bacterium]|nr:hypothetical protein [Thermoanaerobaculia bacterium]
MKTSTSSMSLALTALAVALALAACASGSARAAEGDGVQVTVLLYSGRPNPTFTLTAEQAERVTQLLAAAQPDPDFRGGSVLPSILGYNGLLVRGGAQDLAVYGGRVEIQGREGKRIVSDGGALESFLLEAATQNKALDDEQLRFIRASRDKQQS